VGKRKSQPKSPIHSRGTILSKKNNPSGGGNGGGRGGLSLGENLKTVWGTGGMTKAPLVEFHRPRPSPVREPLGVDWDRVLKNRMSFNSACGTD